MPRNKRMALKRLAAQSHQNLTRAMEDLVKLHEVFEPVHPEYAEFLEAIVAGILFQQQNVERFGVYAWGKWPENVNTWRT